MTQILKSLLLAAVCILAFCSFAAGQSSNDEPAVKPTMKNTLVYNHAALRADRQGPYVLAVGHGDFFQVHFIHTDPRLFNYSIAVTADDQLKTTETGGAAKFVPSPADRELWLAMKHDRHVQRYKVTIAFKEGVQPAGEPSRPAPTDTEREKAARAGTGVELYPVNFDLWVKTSDWEVTFNGGFSFSNLTSDKYYLKKDDKGTPAETDDVKTVEVDAEAKDDFRPDIIVLANVKHTDKFGRLGLAFGVGIGESSDPRYFFGPSYVFGKNFIFTGGWTGGKVSALPVGQSTGKAPINGDNTLNALGTRFAHGFFVGIGFTFVNRQDEFLGALSTSARSEPEPAATEPPAPEPIPLEDLKGTYEVAKPKMTLTVEPSTKGEGLTLTIDAETDADDLKGAALKREAGDKYLVGDDSKHSLTFKAEGGQVTGAVYEVKGQKHEAKLRKP